METKGMELKPCPFCGSENVIFVNGLIGPGMWVSCNDCAAIGPTCQTKEEAESAWNRRYEPPNEPLTLDELREMDVEPVWRVSCPLAEWNIIHSCHPNDVVGGGVIMTRRTAEKRTYPYDGYGKTWFAYRRRPEEENDATT